MNKAFIILALIIGAILAVVFSASNKNLLTTNSKEAAQSSIAEQNPLLIEIMRQKEYPGSDLVIEQTLEDGSNYHQYKAFYKSEGLKIYGLLTVPSGNPPADGWPAIIFNHGYIPPTQYRTTERYVAYVDAFARNGYIVFKSDYRGNGSSEGQPEGAYYSPAYTVDVLNALESLKKLRDPESSSGRFMVDANRIGMWGHSMGGNITLRSLVVKPDDIKVAVIWGGVVGTYYDLANNWQRRVTYQPPPNELALRNRYRSNLIEKYGSPSAASKFWSLIDSNSYLSDIKAPIQLHTGGSDEEVPSAFSQGLFDRLNKLNKTVEFFIYPEGDHNISDPNFGLAMQRSVEFFDKYLQPKADRLLDEKGGGL